VEEHDGVRIVIEARDLPGDGRLRVGVQRRRAPGDLLDAVPGDAERATWTLACTLRGDDVTGEHVEGRPGARFVYLSWTADGATVRRAKLMLDAVPPDVLREAADGDLVARLGLTDPRGGPLCAAVRPPQVTWSSR
jgi:Family of unknown function (DUF5990)